MIEQREPAASSPPPPTPWGAAHPDGTVSYRGLAADPLPHLDEAAFMANFVPDDQRTPEQRAARELADTLARESPRMIALDLGAAEDESLASAHAAIDALFAAAGVPA